jgi:hypothetical protein
MAKSGSLACGGATTTTLTLVCFFGGVLLSTVVASLLCAAQPVVLYRLSRGYPIINWTNFLFLINENDKSFDMFFKKNGGMKEENSWHYFK